MKTTTVVQLSDILFFAEKIGYIWNKAHDILINDEVIPMNETNSYDLYDSDIKNNVFGWSDDTIKIMDNFFKVNQLTMCTLIQ